VSAAFLSVTSAELDRVLPFTAGLYSRDPEYDPVRTRKTCEWLVANPEWGGIWLIQCDGADAGYLIVTVCASIEFHGKMALLDELYIADDRRSRGLGPAAIEFASEWARARGFAALRLELADDNAHALHVYRKSGFLLHERYLMTKWL
jgi:GNAT superfamily N-acetyltransferase